jgi:hypothetical protein
MVVHSEVKAERIPWVPIIILTIFFGFLGPIYLSMSPNATWYSLGAIGCKLMILVMPLLFIMGTAAFAKLLGKSINKTTYTYLYAAGVALAMPSSMWCFPIGGNFIQILNDRIFLAEAVNPWPLYMAPAANIVTPMLLGGAAVPWGDWIPTFAWWWLLQIGCAVFQLSWATIWRRRWIDAENVPFPHTRVSTELVDRVTSAEKSIRARLGLPFVVGAILGIAFQIPLLLTYLFPWFPDIYGWKTNTCQMGTQWLTSDSPLAGIAGLSQFNKNPIFAAIFYMAPLSILFGMWFWFLIFVILTQVTFMMGYYTGITSLAGCGRVWCGTISYRVGDPFKWDVFAGEGLAIGIFISYVAINWRYLVETFNAAIHKISKDKLDEFERSEPTSYRMAYAMLPTSAILIMTLFMISGVGFPAALLLVITNVIVGFVNTRVYSLVGFVVPTGTHEFDGPMKVLLGGGTGGPTREWIVSMGFTNIFANDPVTMGISYPLPFSLASYQMASVNKVSTKNVFRILLFIFLMVPIISVVGTVWGFYAFGIQKMATTSRMWCSCYSGRTPDALVNRPAYDPWWPNVLAGIISAVFLSYMHSRFVWFPLEPIGLLLIADGHAMVEGIWTMGLVAWILKTITLRIGGSKLYERTGIPTAIGFVIGVVVISIIGGALFVFRFFFPF